MTTNSTHSLRHGSHASRKNILTRRSVLGAIAALPLELQAPAHADERGPLGIAQSTALSGPLGELGTAMHQGARPGA